MKNNELKNFQNKKNNKVSVIIALILVVILSFSGGYFSRYIIDNKKSNVVSDVAKVIEKFGFIYDPETGQQRELTEADYANALRNGLLDQYSKYYTAEEYKKEMARFKGDNVDFGFSCLSGSTKVYKVTENSPAMKAGLKAKDFITHVAFNGGEKIKVDNAKHLLEVLSQNKTTQEVVFYVTRGGEFEEKPFVIKQEQYVASYVCYYDNEIEYAFRTDENSSLSGKEIKDKGINYLDDKTGYIRIDQFEGDVSGQFKDAINKMIERGRTKLIIDLRDNGGGYMEKLTDLISVIMYNNGSGNSVIAIAKSKTGEETFRARKNNFRKEIEKISVIANEGTASASECMIGALLCDNHLLNMDRVVIEKNDEGIAKTFGKGIMQNTYLLLSGGAFKLTIANIFWPDGITCIHNKGIIQEGLNATEQGDSAIIRAQQTLN